MSSKINLALLDYTGNYTVKERIYVCCLYEYPHRVLLDRSDVTLMRYTEDAIMCRLQSDKYS